MMARVNCLPIIAAWLLTAVLQAGETLYNGIELPDEWPPRIKELTREPMPVPYLEKRPDVVPIDVGRQLFVDDFLVEDTTLTRTCHLAKYHPATPVLRPDQPWERQPADAKPCAMVFSDGVWFDPAASLFKAWYMGGYCETTCYTTSRDGLHWDKTPLDVVPDTNIVLKKSRDSSTVWLDLNEPDPARRYKMFVVTQRRDGKNGVDMFLYHSADGVHWGKPAAENFWPGDRSSMFYNPFRKKWVYSARIDPPGIGRARMYAECTDLADGLQHLDEVGRLWTCADRLDPRNPNPALRDTPPQLYNLDVVAYESLMIGLFAIWQGDPGRPVDKRNELLLGFSRDGFHWHRPDRRPFAGVNETDGAWNWGNVQSAGGGCLVVGDKLYFYVSGRGKSRQSDPAVTGLAVLRRDGFASMDAGDEPGVLTTRPVVFKGRHLFINADMAGGELRVEILDRDSKPIALFPKRRCMPVTTNTTMQEIRWPEAQDLSSIAGKPVRFRFHMTRGKLYSFWVSADRSGASQGYVAAGGPGFIGHADTVGQAAYDAAARVCAATHLAAASPASQPVWECITAHAPFEPRDCAERFILNGRMWLSNGYWSDQVTFRDLWRSSHDGRLWERVLEQTPYDAYARTVVYRDKVWAIQSSVWNSTDGVQWQKVLDKTPGGGGAHLGALVFKDRIWVLGADRNVWSTTDGVNWIQVTDSAAFGDRACVAVAAYNGKLWLMGGRTERPNDPPEGTYKQFTTHNDVWSSEDGATWIRVNEQAPWAPRMWPVAIEYAGRLWLIGGFDNVNRTNFGDVWTTRDGRTWERFEAIPQFAGRHAATPYVFNDSLWVVAGNTWPIVNDVWRLTLPK